MPWDTRRSKKNSGTRFLWCGSATLTKRRSAMCPGENDEDWDDFEDFDDGEDSDDDFEDFDDDWDIDH